MMPGGRGGGAGLLACRSRFAVALALPNAGTPGATVKFQAGRSARLSAWRRTTRPRIPLPIPPPTAGPMGSAHALAP